MQPRHHGKYTKMSRSFPAPIARCDYSGFMVAHRGLVKQKEYRGAGLVWTGYYVYKKFQDQPNPQNLAPIIRLDPQPVPDARPDNQVLAFAPNQLTTNITGMSRLVLNTEQASYTTQILTGTPNPSFILQVPQANSYWKVVNATDELILVCQIGAIGAPLNPTFEVEAHSERTFYGNGLTLSPQTPTPQ